MKIRCDWHIHSRHSSCGNKQTTLELIVEQARAAGLRSFGVADHLHAKFSEPHLLACRAEYDAMSDKEGFHFGIEVGVLREYDHRQQEQLSQTAEPCDDWADMKLVLPLSRQLLEQLQPEYIIGSAHWPLGAPFEREAIIRSYHRQNMFLATHPEIDIVAHPWCWGGGGVEQWRDADGYYHTLPWLDDFSVISKSMHDEFAAATIEHSTAIEINAKGVLLNPRYPESFRRQYLKYLAGLKDAGVRFSFASDSHHYGYESSLLYDIEACLDQLGLQEEDFWRPSERKKEVPVE
jgi:histidinol phosphatase-like PHP family hydrolase